MPKSTSYSKKGWKEILRIGRRCKDHVYRFAHSEPPLPPRPLRRHVMTNPTCSNYSRRGKRMIEDLSLVLKSVNRSIADFEQALDMGSGAGCVERWLVQLYPQLKISASDIHAPSIAWLGRNFPNIDVNVNQPEPPLKYASGTFDLIWVFSLFTHLSERRQFSWREELRRVARPRAAIVLTTNGVDAARRFQRTPLAGWGNDYRIEPDLLSEKGFVFIPYRKGGDYGMTYHFPAYVRETWSRYFRELAYFPSKLDDLQDMWVLEPKGSE